MNDQFIPDRSTRIEDLPPSQKLNAAISILQAYILAEDSALIPQRMFGTCYMKEPGLEMVERLLMDIAPSIAGSVGDPLAEGRQAAPSRILELFREHRRLGEEAATYEVPEGADDDKVIEALFWDPRTRIEEEMLSLPSTSAADFAAKMVVNTSDGEFLTDWETGKLCKEARQLLGIPEPETALSLRGAPT